ncbi:MAG: hypothetical protein HWN81_11020 [Candidatus Lokiarchaeota archaeon]|nr:hypothetical protein [Candidatus Lokiarchaeota archaeon]
MLFQDIFLNFGFWDALEMGLYFIIVGYFVLLFFYFLLIRYRTSKKLYWLFFSFLFICFGIGRVFFIIYYFFAPELYTGTNGDEVVAFLMMNYRLATFFTWLGTACAVGVLGILLFPPETQEGKTRGGSFKDWFKNRNNITLLVRIGLFIIPVVIGILTLTLPESLFIDPDFIDDYGITIEPINVNILGWEYPLCRFLWNFIFMPLFVTLIPFIFLYLAWKTFGVLRKSYALNAIGFFLYFIGRILQGALDVAVLPHVRAILPPLIILLALLILVIANTYEQLK